ncbi:hypothetical protein PS028_24075, partial [Shigella sonnei]|nr:hypothetical protein [Shigella sonnei]
AISYLTDLLRGLGFQTEVKDHWPALRRLSVWALLSSQGEKLLLVQGLTFSISFFCFRFFRAAPEAYGSPQAKG